MNQDKLDVVINGQSAVCDIYFTLMCNENNRGYIAYTDHSKDEDGKEKVYISFYDPNVGPTELFEITDPKELELVNAVIEKVKSL